MTTVARKSKTVLHDEKTSTIEWIQEIWLRALNRGLEPEAKPAEELF